MYYLAGIGSLLQFCIIKRFIVPSNWTGTVEGYYYTQINLDSFGHTLISLEDYVIKYNSYYNKQLNIETEKQLF